MGNSTPGKSFVGSAEKKACESNNGVVDRSKVLYLDPRSPSEGIVRTPIQLDRREKGCNLQDSLTVAPENQNGHTCFSKLANVGDVCVIELNNFETLDGFLTEDDSIHRPDLVEERVSSLSDTNVNHKGKNSGNLTTPCTLPKARLSLLERLNKQRSARDSPSLFVRMRQKHDYEKRRQDRCHQHGGDGVPGDSGQSREDKSQDEVPIAS